ncbi:hypothetical protein BO78DRAFT_438560 [Aspergillus sclerotiicarbonarius CBS 121057]|uniref:Uncharacterized protein n=1 Tax=Aspergillus sclerotiicarbonarius (strain CBS 121057 / IBT 28362) TaxID=1448318 RepID=A0A319DS30_ASPSB|nr:hypothetical protein BO78DRAFT_438560 [Aspergillus sclerotiicarbonarius CBS 121057]
MKRTQSTTENNFRFSTMSQPPAKRRKLSATPPPSTADLIAENFEAIAESFKDLRSHIARGRSQMKELQDCLDVLEIQLDRLVALERGDKERRGSGTMAGESGFDADTEWSSSPGSSFVGSCDDPETPGMPECVDVDASEGGSDLVSIKSEGCSEGCSKYCLQGNDVGDVSGTMSDSCPEGCPTRVKKEAVKD